MEVAVIDKLVDSWMSPTYVCVCDGQITREHVADARIEAPRLLVHDQIIREHVDDAVKTSLNAHSCRIYIYICMYLYLYIYMYNIYIYRHNTQYSIHI